jgi:hypothetical protein
MINGDNGCQRDDNFFMDELIYRLGPSRTTSTSCHRDIARVLGGGDVTKEGTGANRGVGHGGRRHGRGRHQIRSGWGEEDGDVVEEGVGATDGGALRPMAWPVLARWAGRAIGLDGRCRTLVRCSRVTEGAREDNAAACR